MNPWPERRVTAAYIHIPFCVSKCRYCDFISFPGIPLVRQVEYVRRLTAEIDQTADRIRLGELPLDPVPLETVFFGGGTPSLLPAIQLADLLVHLSSRFGLAPDAEVTLEANPGTVTPEGLRKCREAGFNRISLGLQSASRHLLKILGRIHDAEDFRKSVIMAAEAGFDRISADIMFGLPGQTESDIRETLNLVLDLPIGHVSFYGLILEEGTPMFDEYHARPGLLRLPDDEQERAQYHLIRHCLAERGFVHYEISSSALPGQQCRHNMVYWHGLPYFGFGAAAHSFFAGARRANPGTLESYALPFEPVVLENVDRDGGMKEMMLLGLRLVDGIRIADFIGRFGMSPLNRFPDEINRLKDRGLLLQEDGRLHLSEIGLDLANQVFVEFV